MSRKITQKKLFLFGMLVMLLVVLVGCSSNAVTFSGSYSGQESSKRTETGWTYSLKGSANRTGITNVNFSADNLDVFHAKSTSGGGQVSLIISQGDTELTVNLTGEFNEDVDMSGFEPGRIKLQLVLKDAVDVDVILTWS